MKELSEKDKEILAILAEYPQGLFLHQVQKYAHISLKQYALYYLKKLIKKGLVRREGRLYFAVIGNPRSVAEPITETQDKPIAPGIRIHSLALAFPLRNKLGAGQPAMLGIQGARLSGLKNQQSVYFEQEGLKLMLTPSSLIIYAEQLKIALNASVGQEIGLVVNRAYSIALKVEDTYGLSLVRLRKDILLANIMLNHNAMTNHEVANIVLDMKEKFEVRDLQGTLRVIVDFSNNIPEFEAVDAQYGLQDLAKLKKFTLAVINGDFDYAEEKAARQANTELITRYAKQIELHLKIMAKIDRKLSQKSMREYL